MGRKHKRAWRSGHKTQEVRVFFTQKNEKEVDFQTEYVQDFCDWNLDNFVGFVQAQALQEVTCCVFMLKDERNYEAIQRLNTEAALRGIHLPIPVKIMSAHK